MMVDIPDEEVAAILKEYAPLVRGIARSTYTSSPALDLNDLYQIGDIAVLRAVREYDPTSGMSMRSFVTKLVRQDIYNEAARFLGIFTVDRRVTRLASRVNDLHQKGKSDTEIANTLEISEQQAKDLRFVTTSRRYAGDDPDTQSAAPFVSDDAFNSIFEAIVHNDLERKVLECRVLGDLSLQETSQAMNMSMWKVANIERKILSRIRRAIEDVAND